jgi:2'-5' RNA ligase
VVRSVPIGVRWAHSYAPVMQRSGLIIEVPEASPVVDPWRQQLDPLAPRGVPPHITVLFPFVDATDISQDTTAKVQRLAASVRSFRFRLTHAGWFEPQVLWLAPAPSEPFVELTARAAEAFPDYPPYGGQFTEVIPHLTIGDGGAAEQMAAAARDLLPGLPISATANAITLMVERPDRHWQVRARFPLASS